MLIQLTSDQIAKHWDIIKVAIEDCMPPLSHITVDTMNRVLELLLTGNMHCWVYQNDERKIIAVVVTTFYYDYPSATQDLLLYAVWGANLSEGVWTDGFTTLMRFAEANNCKTIYGFTSAPELVELAKHFGAQTQTYIGIPVREV